MKFPNHHLFKDYLGAISIFSLFNKNVITSINKTKNCLFMLFSAFFLERYLVGLRVDRSFKQNQFLKETTNDGLL